MNRRVCPHCQHVITAISTAGAAVDACPQCGIALEIQSALEETGNVALEDVDLETLVAAEASEPEDSDESEQTCPQDADTSVDIVSPTLETTGPFPREPAVPREPAENVAASVTRREPYAGISVARFCPQKNKSRLRTFVACLLLAIVIVPVAQGVLWWLPGNWGQDPLGLAPVVSGYVPSIVPAKFYLSDDSKASRPNRLQSLSHVEHSSGDSDEATPPTQLVDESSNAMRSQHGETTVVRVDPGQVVVLSHTQEDSGVAAIQPAEELTDPAHLIAGNEFAEEKDLADLQADLTAEEEWEEPEIAVLPSVMSAPTFIAEDLHEVFRRAEQFHAEFMLATMDDKRSMVSDWQLALNELGEKVAYLEGSAQDTSSALTMLTDWCLELATDEKALNLVSRSARSWLSVPNRTHSGIFLAGTVQAVRNQARYQELYVVQPLKTGRALETFILFPQQDPESRSWGTGDKVIVLGAIIEDPEIRVSGYEGPSRPLIWTGLIVPVE
ncbi:MAG: hypothetical protein MK179_00485 [Pirellulaceae bacterium]|nr:hypothetical protein [Pirellulaceae bacterium]